MVPEIDHKQQKEFAVRVVATLRARGHQALWAGGCVRDHLLGRTPKDFDVATDARPQEVREAFGQRRTLAVGAAFGVITVLGRRGEGQIEVATFRSDSTYSDGRHPDSIRFSSPEEDAQRRDFTINGMFFDPIKEEVIDFVGGQRDLAERLVRAIGEPRQRIAEDKLRMLRAVRFTACLDFSLDPATGAAITELAGELTGVSAERIAAEMSVMLLDAHRSRAVRLLDETGLLDVVLPEVATLAHQAAAQPAVSPDPWQQTLRVLDELADPTFPLALAALLHATGPSGDGTDSDDDAVQAARQIAGRWRASNHVRDRTVWLLTHRDALVDARRMRWSQLHPLLLAPGSEELLHLHAAAARAAGLAAEPVDHCRALQARPREEIDPPPLINGNDLVAHGLTAGRRFSHLLERVRAAQLDGLVHTQGEALDLVDRLRAETDPPDEGATP